MVDKLDLRIPRRTPFSPAFQRLYPELQALEKGPFRPSEYYEYVGDLRQYGHNVRLNLYCQMEKTGNHKLELIDVGEMRRDAIIREINQIFDVNPSTLGIMRLDLAGDVPRLPVQWFRETVQVEHKRYRAAVTGERFHAEMGKGEIQTLYFGKRPNLIRIYDKEAECREQFKKMVRTLGKDFEGTFESVFPEAVKHPVLTRVERQMGGRVPVEVATLGQVFDSGYEYRPFAKMKIVNHPEPFEGDPSASFETYCTGMYLRKKAQDDGMQAVKQLIAEHSKRNTAWAWKKYEPYLFSAYGDGGLTSKSLQALFAASMQRQMTR